MSQNLSSAAIVIVPLRVKVRNITDLNIFRLDNESTDSLGSFESLR